MNTPVSFQTLGKYPEMPGTKSSVDTTQDAADQIASRAAVIRQQVLELLKTGDFTADEMAALLQTIPGNVRPRCSELSTKGEIVDSGDRRKNENDKNQIVWQLRSKQIINQETINNALISAVQTRERFVGEIFALCKELNDLNDDVVWSRKTLNKEIERLYQVINTPTIPALDGLGFEALKEVRELLQNRLAKLQQTESAVGK